MCENFKIINGNPISQDMLSDPSSFSKIYLAVVQDLYAYGRSLNVSKEYVEDAIQDISAKVFATPRDFENLQHLKFFLFQSLKNNVYDRYRKESRLSNFDDFSLSISINPPILENILKTEEQAELTLRVETLLETLTPNQKEIIFLRYIQGLDYNEIADLLNTKPATIRKMASRAIQKLRKEESFRILLLLFI